jgi:hypothetical protein
MPLDNIEAHARDAPISPLSLKTESRFKPEKYGLSQFGRWCCRTRLPASDQIRVSLPYRHRLRLRNAERIGIIGAEAPVPIADLVAQPGNSHQSIRQGVDA